MRKFLSKILIFSFVIFPFLTKMEAAERPPKLTRAAQKVLNYWFGNLSGPEDFPNDRLSFWFGKDPTIDREICKKFKFFMITAGGGMLENWKNTPRGRLALILLLDQFPRNIYRDSKEAFRYDTTTQLIVLEGIEKGDDLQLLPIERIFFYLPLEHAENLPLQKMSLHLFERLVQESLPSVKEKYQDFANYARSHLEIIQRFGRFPHRNQQLHRQSTQEEIEFLQQPNSSF